MTNKIIIIDLEATCWEGIPQKGEVSEIIEIGFCLLDTLTGEISDNRGILVKPTHSKISPFCTQLTTITPELVAREGVSFEEALQILKREYQAYQYTWASYGNYDRNMLQKQCALRKLPYPMHNEHINVKELFQEVTQHPKRLGMYQALNYLKIPLVGTSPEVDIAVLKINSNETFKPLEFANSDQVQIGQWSIAFGNPLGLNDSMTVGIVSAAGRSSLGIEEIENFIQTDAAINQGNSGGPLIDIAGKVIGVNTAIYSQSGGSVGIGFAIPANLVMTVKDSIIANGKFEKPYIGVYLDNLDENKVKALNLKSSNGVFIGNVVPNGPAAAAGITKNDVITAVDGKSVNSAGAFVGEIAAKKVGQTIKLTVLRNGQSIEIPVNLIKTPNAIEQQRIIQQRQQQQLGR
ncbi:MAG: trypsin-like peptidase domain-containing protein [Leptotrichia hongkongensis]